METISEQTCFGGKQGFYAHDSEACKGTMKFAVYVPPQAKNAPVPVVTYLAGLTCTEETFVIKAGAQRVASELGLMLVAPDTSPRGAGYAGEEDDWDFGTGAGFYLNATQEPWSGAYNMYDYVTKELQWVISSEFNGDMDRQGIMGHSMGGHGALTIHLKNPDLFKSVSAFAPITSPMNCPWGHKALGNYIGEDRQAWEGYDSCALVKSKPSTATLFVDQGLEDQFLVQELKPELLEEACEQAGQKLNLRRHDGHDHSYYFIQTFMEDHLRHHHDALS